MDANGTRFHLLLGDADWKSCRCTRQADAPGAQWQAPYDATAAAKPASDSPAPAEWNVEASELTLRRRPFRFDPAPADTPVDLERDRRGAAADLFGNWYWVAESRTGIRVRSAGSGRISAFWPPEPTVPPASPGGFAPAESASTAGDETTLGGVAVTAEHYLAVGTLQPPGLLIFDLFSGGPPRQLLWPAAIDFEPFDLAACPLGRLGELGILDRTNRRCWILDRHFQVVRRDQPAATGGEPAAQTFQPDPGGGSRRIVGRVFSAGIGLDDALALPTTEAAAIEALADGTWLVLANPPGPKPTGFSEILVVRNGQLAQRLSTEPMKEQIDRETRDGFSLIGHDMAFVPGTGAKSGAKSGAKTGAKDKACELGRLYIADSGGNQSYVFRLVDDGAGVLSLDPLPEYLPMRCFHGRGLVVYGGMPYYDFAETWVPLVRQPRPRHEPEASVRTRIFDGRQPDCVWHRLLLDGSIPTDCRVRVWSRAGDEQAQIDFLPWLEEPPLYRRSDGSELPWLRSPWPASRGSAPGAGTWELLLRHARGRYLQLRFDLAGNERSTPRLRALRVWYPRFSYLAEYLPAVYREDAGSAAFLDGFLANLEGFWTATEDRIAAAQILFDWRSAPAEALEWLAGWFGVALDPAWDEPRRRLFIRHAMLFFQYRGTAHGLRLALSLALDREIDESRFTSPERVSPERFGVRLIEKYRTRKLPDVLFGDPSQLEAPAVPEADSKPWSPAEGGLALRRRYARFTGKPESPLPEFPLLAPEEKAGIWVQFCEQALGYTPWAAALERQAWRLFLATAYVDADALDRAWRTQFADFERIGLPADQPADAVIGKDWLAYMRQTAVARMPVERIAWQAFLRSRHATLRALNAQYATAWQAFDLIPLPERLPADGAALEDWFQFESAVLAMRGTAHRFSVLLPMPTGPEVMPDEPQRRLDLARRIVALEKPAHTVFDLRFYWAMFRVGEARLGHDTLIDIGARERLIPPLVLGRGYLGEACVSPTEIESRADRRILGRDRLNQ